jgi:crossover junction endodeoxyribonuclease RuvC
MTLIVGIDPGLYGAIVKLDPEAHTLQVFEMPILTIQKTKKKTFIDQVRLGTILCDDNILRLYLEEVNARPEEGVVSSFTFGQAYGTVIGAAGALEIPTTFVRPAIWKKSLKVPADKDAARYRASQLFPQCASAWVKRSQDGLAEASLIAFYGMCELNFPVRKKFTLKV